MKINIGSQETSYLLHEDHWPSFVLGALGKFICSFIQ